MKIYTAVFTWASKMKTPMKIFSNKLGSYIVSQFINEFTQVRVSKGHYL